MTCDCGAQFFGHVEVTAPVAACVVTPTDPGNRETISRCFDARKSERTEVSGVNLPASPANAVLHLHRRREWTAAAQKRYFANPLGSFWDEACTTVDSREPLESGQRLQIDSIGEHEPLRVADSEGL
jgi:hypothetical protein